MNLDQVKCTKCGVTFHVEIKRDTIIFQPICDECKPKETTVSWPHFKSGRVVIDEPSTNSQGSS
jgi:NAD-dependent SIR2 family protein deacetylase